MIGIVPTPYPPLDSSEISMILLIVVSRVQVQCRSSDGGGGRWASAEASRHFTPLFFPPFHTTFLDSSRHLNFSLLVAVLIFHRCSSLSCLPHLRYYSSSMKRCINLRTNDNECHSIYNATAGVVIVETRSPPCIATSEAKFDMRFTPVWRSSISNSVDQPIQRKGLSKRRARATEKKMQPRSQG